MVLVCADADTQRLLERFIERGQARECLRPFRWRSILNPMRDTLVAHPESVVDVFARPLPTVRLVLVWDHQGCGREHLAPARIEADVATRLRNRGMTDDSFVVVCVAPEVEVMLSPVWERAKGILASKRGLLPPDDADVIRRARAIQRDRPRPVPIPDDATKALRDCPKELFDGLLAAVNLRRSPALFEEIGDHVSIRQVKAVSCAKSISDKLVAWFGPTTRH
jgi:hypothetical protein